MVEEEGVVWEVEEEGGRGDMAQSAPSEEAETEEACGWPLQNSRPALTHFAAGRWEGEGEGGWG